MTKRTTPHDLIEYKCRKMTMDGAIVLNKWVQILQDQTISKCGGRSARLTLVRTRKHDTSSLKPIHDLTNCTMGVAFVSQWNLVLPPSGVSNED